jgi:hypothetical protein
VDLVGVLLTVATALYFGTFATNLVLRVCFPGRIGRGALTRWLNRLRHGREWRNLLEIQAPVACFAAAFVALWVAPLAADFLLVIAGVLMFGFDVDDLLFGDDDDRWKRRREAARNRISWKMPLPAPRVPNPGGAAP